MFNKHLFYAYCSIWVLKDKEFLKMSLLSSHWRNKPNLKQLQATEGLQELDSRRHKVGV